MSAATQSAREVEVKYRVHDRAALLAALAAIHGVRLGHQVEQDDQAYAREGWRYGDSKLGVPFARLRTEAGRHLFTLKRPVENELSCVEYETEITDREAMHHAILAMGFYPTVRIIKTRQTGKCGDLTLCLDDVAGVGCFFEVETLAVDDGSGLVDQDGMHDFVTRLGVSLERTAATYDSLVHARSANSVMSSAH